MLRTLRSRQFRRPGRRPGSQPQPKKAATFTKAHQRHREYMMQDMIVLDQVDYLRTELITLLWQQGTYVTLLVDLGEHLEEHMPEKTSFFAITDTLEMYTREIEQLLNEMEEVVLRSK